MAEDLFNATNFDATMQGNRVSRGVRKVVEILASGARETTKFATGAVAAALNYSDFMKTGEPQYLSWKNRLMRLAKAFGEGSFLGRAILNCATKDNEEEAVKNRIKEYEIDAEARRRLGLDSTPGVENVALDR
ncbi:MAG: hypothetical protein IKQ31_03665 [Clostridia bacterium]|nr:hypothetical protein [Clostridia bacterium]